MYIRGETGMFKAVPIFSTEYYTVYNVYGTNEDFLYRTTELNQRMTERDNLALIRKYESHQDKKVVVTAAERNSKSGDDKRGKLLPSEVRQIRQMFRDGMNRKQIAEQLEMHYATVDGIVNGRTYTEVM